MTRSQQFLSLVLAILTLTLVGCWRSISRELELRCDTDGVQCDQGLECSDDGRCRCTPTSCDGCCSSEGDVCRDGDDDSSCGFAGGLCRNCSTDSLLCIDGECIEDAVCEDEECNIEGESSCLDEVTLERCVTDERGCLIVAIEGCAEGEICANGECGQGCAQSCGTTETRICVGNDIEICDGPDADGCYGWRVEATCSRGLICEEGYCVCDNKCSYVGELGCVGNSTATCAENEEGPENCLEWVMGDSCGDRRCEVGICVADCSGECRPIGRYECNDAGSEQRQCVASDECNMWSPWTNCPPETTCTSDGCVGPCDLCGPEGTERCSSDGRGIERCTLDGDRCLDWQPNRSCSSHEVCLAGDCVCDNECDFVNQLECVDGETSHTCAIGAGSCLEWGPSATCLPEYHCEEGVGCVADCPSFCNPALGTAPLCIDEGNYEICVVDPEYGCGNIEILECASGEVCNASCGDPCFEECPFSGATDCFDANTRRECSITTDGLTTCAHWIREPCEPGSTCVDGECGDEFCDLCTFGERRCTWNDVEICNDVDGDGCASWSYMYSCAPEETCESGFCEVSCNICEIENIRGCDSLNPNMVYVCTGGCWEEDHVCEPPSECRPGGACW